MKISFIMSLWNGSKWLEQRLENLYKNGNCKPGCNELIIIHCSDNLDEYEKEKNIIAKWKHMNYHIIPGENLNIYQAWNRGIDIATGEWISNANVDDLIGKDYIETMKKAAIENFDCSIFYTDIARVNENNEVIGAFKFYDFDRDLLHYQCYMGPMPMWNRYLHIKYGMFDESFQSAGDYEFWLRCVTNGEKAFHIPEIHGTYFVNPDGRELRDSKLAWDEHHRVMEMYPLEKKEHKITVMISSYNEQDRIGDVLESVSEWADEIIVRDKSSTDKTVEICKNYGAKVITVPYSEKGHTESIDLKKSKNDWIFFITCSEIPTRKLIESVKQCLFENGDFLSIINIPKKIYSFGIHDERSPWSVSYQPFLVNRNRIIYQNHIHSEYIPKGQTMTIPYADGCCMYHLTHPSVDDFLEDHQSYSRNEAKIERPFEEEVKRCFDQIEQWIPNLLSDDSLIPHYCAWNIYWLQNILYAWERDNGNAIEKYKAIREKILKEEWRQNAVRNEKIRKGIQNCNKGDGKRTFEKAYDEERRCRADEGHVCECI